MEKCEANANEIKNLEKRITALEQYREKDKTELHQLDTSLQVFINEMKNISDELKGIVTNFKEAIIRSTNAQEKEIASLKEKVVSNEAKMEKLEAKLEHETTEADAKKYQEIRKYIITTIIGLILGFVAMYLGMK